MNGRGGGGIGGGFGGGFGGRNATPEAEESLAKILRGIQLNPYGPEGNGLPTGTQTSGPTDLSWFFRAIQGAQPNGLPTGTQTSDPTGNDALYKLKMIGSGILGYPETGVFNAPNPRSQEAIKASLEQKRVKGLLG